MSVGGPATSRRRLLVDRLASMAIHGVGIGIVALVLLILWYLLSVTLPLARPYRIATPVSLDSAARVSTPVAPAVGAAYVHSAVATRSGVAWRFDSQGNYRCSTAAAYRALPGPVQGPLRGAALTAREETVLLLDAAGVLHRFAVAGGGRCELSALGPGYEQPFEADVLLAERGRPLALLLQTTTGRLRVVQSATGSVVFDGQLPGVTSVQRLMLTDDGSALEGRSGGRTLRWALASDYAEVSWRTLWQQIWYPGYAEPAHVWHSGGGDTGAGPRFALTPLLWGTFKAALYGMLIAVPVALGAAIYTGYFLPQRMRNRIKPAIELLEAFPTVVLGFFAGIWLAPLLGDYLVGIFLLPLLLLGLPLLLAALHLLAQQLSPRFRRRPPRVPLLATGYFLGLALLFWYLPQEFPELFGERGRATLLKMLGLQYEQRNALLVGLAMGFALVPTLFSIIEDAIFAVPRSLSDASLALGATRWQSMARVVLPAASPAILSALLIGLARGLGETMIVLLASGNTPIIEASAFSGMRSVSASLAAELPDATVGGVEFRVLFLAALVLFALTFVLNTAAELFRQRLRYRYAGR